MNAETRELTLRVDAARRRRMTRRGMRPPLTARQRLCRRNEEIVKQYTGGKVSLEIMAGLTGLELPKIVAILNRRRIRVGRKPLKVIMQGPRGILTVPPVVRKGLPPDARFTCELVPDGIFYRRVDEADRRKERAA